ncbi:MAG: 2-C-methyl-D-erythritol 4-phosphate cytidylyltransferase [Acidimicrobiia bacterium]|jgi:2-C-methyl-D-erythritol 4-phosphate cytidylyltransferase
MPTRAMIIVGGGSSTRFGSDKLLAEVAGRPLIAHTIDAVADHVDSCVVVCRPEILDEVVAIREGIIAAPGGATRTLSEMAGLAALGGEVDLIGIHDAARPAVEGALVDLLFSTAAEQGGAVPVVAPEKVILDRKTHRPAMGLRLAQTPQVFRGPDLMSAYVKAARTGYEAHDTVEVMQRFAGVTIVAVPGDPANVKVTFPEDLDPVSETIRARSRT